MIIQDASGTLTGTRSDHRDTAGNAATILVGRNIGERPKRCNFAATCGRLERKRVPFTVSDDRELHFVPLAAREREVARVVFILEKKPLPGE